MHQALPAFPIHVTVCVYFWTVIQNAPLHGPKVLRLFRLNSCSFDYSFSMSPNEWVRKRGKQLSPRSFLALSSPIHLFKYAFKTIWMRTGAKKRSQKKKKSAPQWMDALSLRAREQGSFGGESCFLLPSFSLIHSCSLGLIEKELSNEQEGRKRRNTLAVRRRRSAAPQNPVAFWIIPS